MAQDELKQMVAKAALDYVEENSIIGIGTGSTMNYFIDCLATIKDQIKGTVASSIATEKKLKAYGIPVFDFNSVAELPLYVDGADACTHHRQLTKGGGGALTREKILATASKQFICIIDDSKKVEMLGEFPIPIEVIPMARSYVGREMVKLGGKPVYREQFVTDNGNLIIDVHNLKITDPIKLERELNNIPGIVCHGLFAERTADIVLISGNQGMKVLGANQFLINRIFK